MNMEKFKTIAGLSVAALLCSCGSTGAEQTQSPGTDTIIVDSTAVTADPAWGADTTTTINFADLSVQISRLIVYDESGVLGNTITDDSVNLSIELGEGIEGEQIFVSSDQLVNINVEQRYETSVKASAEGPHCDLIDWKHFTSPWNSLESPAANYFTAEIYTPEMTQQFPPVSIDELKKETERMCEGWGDVVKDATSLYDYPFSIGISRIWLRVTGERVDTGEKAEKIIAFEVPMGC